MRFFLISLLSGRALGFRLSFKANATTQVSGDQALGMPEIPEPCGHESCVVLDLARSSSSELDQVVPTEIPVSHGKRLWLKMLFKRFLFKMLKSIRPADAAAVLTTSARLAVWGTALGVTIAFPPASLAVAGASAFLGFLVTAVSTIHRDGNLNVFKSRHGWCSLFSQVAQDLFVGVTGGISGAVPAVILTYDVLEAVITDWKDLPSVSDASLCGKVNLADALNEIRSKRHQSALALMSAMPWLDHVDCPCDQCLHPLNPKQLCDSLEAVCHPSWAHKYVTGVCNCDIQKECYENDAAGFAEMLLSQTKALLKAD